MQILFAELRALGREILEDDLKRTFFRELPESGKNNFLQLSSMDMYKNNLNNLCLEVIRRNEELESSLNVKSDTANIVAHNNGKMTGKCFTCGKAGHRRFDCKSKPLNDTNSQRHHSNVKTKPHFKKNRFDRKR